MILPADIKHAAFQRRRFLVFEATQPRATGRTFDQGQRSVVNEMLPLVQMSGEYERRRPRQ